MSSDPVITEEVDRDVRRNYEVEVIVTEARSEIYHITAASEQAAREEALWGCVHPVNDNYRTDVHHREVWEVTEMKG